MTISAFGKPWTCEKCRKPGQRARLADFTWSTYCTACLKEFRDCIAAHRAKSDKLWFLKRRQR